MVVVIDNTEVVGKFETYDEAADFAYAYEVINNTNVIIREE